MPYRRLEVEAIRDSMLAVSGQLNPRMYGPSMYPHSQEALAGHSDPDKSGSLRRARRVPANHLRLCQTVAVVPMMEVLDFCDTTRSTAQRTVTSVAPQALTLFNGDFVNRQARYLAERLRAEAGHDPGKQIERAYRLALCRPPTSEEQRRRSISWRQNPKRLPGDAATLRLRRQLCRVILNLNEFVYPD